MIDRQRLLLFFFFFFLINIVAFAQPEAAVWYFGAKAGLDFRHNPPSPLLNGQMNSNEGGAAICDENANLLFYTDGVRVWNKEHRLMNNGNHLLGHPSAAQSGIIAPMPLNRGKYYVFTVDAEAGDNGLCYSIVDMTADTLGVVTNKNINVLKKVQRK